MKILNFIFLISLFSIGFSSTAADYYVYDSYKTEFDEYEVIWQACVKEFADKHHLDIEFTKEKTLPFLSMENEISEYERFFAATLTFTDASGQTKEHSTRIGYTSTTQKENARIVYTNLLETFLTKQKESQIEPPPFLVDVIDPANYFGTENFENKMSSTVIPLTDGSFIYANENQLLSLDIYGNIHKNLMEELPADIPLGSKNWKITSNGNKLYVNINNDSKIYQFEDDTVKKTSSFLPSTSTLYSKITKDGNFIYAEPFNRYSLLCKSDSTEQIRQNFPCQLNTIFFQNNEILWGSYYNQIIALDKNNNIKKIYEIGDDPYNLTNISYVFDDSSFIITTPTTVDISTTTCYRADGSIKWTLTDNPFFGFIECVGQKDGFYYFVNKNTRKIYRYADSTAKIPENLRNISSCYQKIAANSVENNFMYLEIAKEYLKTGAEQSAYSNLKNYLSYNAADTDASQLFFSIEFSLARKFIEKAAQRTRDLFEDYGEETAKDEYKKAMTMLEKYRKQNPFDPELNTTYNELRHLYNPESTKVSHQVPELEVVDFDLAVLFPVLMNVYANQPSGYITVRNNSDTEMTDISVTANIKKYMDFPSQGEVVHSLKPGETCQLYINTVLNEKALDIPENITLQTQFTIGWTQNDKKTSFNLSRPITMFMKNAISWEDTAMLSCFILPNDRSVLNFAYNAIDKSKRSLSTNISNAAMIVNALGEIPLKYIPDPIRPVSANLKNNFAVDTVRFPYETLSLKGGDCDDMTTLFCSMLESIGIPSALITTKEHIFVAFDTNLKSNLIWKSLPQEYATLAIDNHIWIPVETTVLTNGFVEAWKKASEEISNEEYEVTLLSKAFETYRSAASDKKAVAVDFNQKEKSSKDDMTFDFIKDMIQTVLAKSVKTADYDTLNAIAKYYTLIGENQKALDVLFKSYNMNPSYKSSYNLSQMLKKTNAIESQKYYEISEKLKIQENFMVENQTENSVQRASSLDQETSDLLLE